jgi:hypothetical protein
MSGYDYTLKGLSVTNHLIKGFSPLADIKFGKDGHKAWSLVFKLKKTKSLPHLKDY